MICCWNKTSLPTRAGLYSQSPWPILKVLDLFSKSLTCSQSPLPSVIYMYNLYTYQKSFMQQNKWPRLRGQASILKRFFIQWVLHSKYTRALTCENFEAAARRHRHRAGQGGRKGRAARAARAGRAGGAMDRAGGWISPVLGYACVSTNLARSLLPLCSVSFDTLVRTSESCGSSCGV
jgi:hypothetical protein